MTLNGSVSRRAAATSTLTVGSHPVAAIYSGNTNFTGSTSTVIATQTVNQATSTTTLTSSANPSVFGQPVTLTATVKNGATADHRRQHQLHRGRHLRQPDTVLQANQTPSADRGRDLHDAPPSRWRRTASSRATTAARGFAASQATLTQTVNKAATTTTISSDTPDPSTRRPGGDGQLRRRRDACRAPARRAAT